MGLENLGKHIVGDGKWEKLYDGCAGSSSATEQEESGGPQDFEPDKTPETVEVSPPVRNRKGNTPTRTVLEPEGEMDDEEDDEEDELEKNDEVGPHLNSSPINNGNDIGKEEEENKEENGEVNSVEVDDDEPLDESISPLKEGDTVKLKETKSNDIREDEGIMEDGEEGDERNLENEVDHQQDIDRQSCSTPNSQIGGGMRGDGESIGSPAPSEAAAGEEKGGGGALVDNLFQILPYWYFLNRAFGLQGGECDEVSQGMNPLSHASNSEGIDEDDDERESYEGGGGGRRSSSPQQSNSNPNPKLNSILFLESLRQQLQGQGGQLTPPNEQFLQQGIQLSDILNRMSGAGSGGAAGANSSIPNVPWRGGDRSGIPSQSLDGHAHHILNSAPGDLEVDDQPLDLTSGTSKGKREDSGMNKIGFRPGGEFSTGPGRMDNNDIQSPFILDEHTSKVFRSNPRSSKGYTAQELQAALHDIQSGKLGTRRAAVIYGIPRSTLRNKVYKLGKDRSRLFNNQNGPGGVAALHNNNNNSLNHNNNIPGKESVGSSGSLLGKLSYLQGLNASNYLSPHHTRAAATRLSTGTGEGEDTDEAGSSYIKHLRKPPTLYPMNNGGGNSGNDGKGSPPKLRPKSSLSELISKHAQQQRGPQQLLHHHYNNVGGGMGMEVDDPSYHSGDNEPNIPTSLLSQSDWKSAFSRHEHIRSHHLQRDDMQASSTMPNHHRQQLYQQGDDGANSMDLAGKKSRPKRGKYRNYDREALVKAVRAVQNGEMSVHRAGSFFGVPHSTLEYKVKERHLLRRPKRKEVTSPVSQTKSSSPESSSDAPPTSIQTRQGAFPQSSFYPKGKSLSNNVSSTGGSSYLFPLTSDLRESLSRYLSAEQQEPRSGGGSDTHSEMDVGPSSGQTQNDDEDQLLIRRSTRKQPADEDEPKAGPFALEGLIGSRLSSLFQLNDMLIRSSGGEERGSGTESLDLSKK